MTHHNHWWLPIMEVCHDHRGSTSFSLFWCNFYLWAICGHMHFGVTELAKMRRLCVFLRYHECSAPAAAHIADSPSSSNAKQYCMYGWLLWSELNLHASPHARSYLTAKWTFSHHYEIKPGQRAWNSSVSGHTTQLSQDMQSDTHYM